jgi:hypothetical protein
MQVSGSSASSNPHTLSMSMPGRIAVDERGQPELLRQHDRATRARSYSRMVAPVAAVVRLAALHFPTAVALAQANSDLAQHVQLSERTSVFRTSTVLGLGAHGRKRLSCKNVQESRKFVHSARHARQPAQGLPATGPAVAGTDRRQGRQPRAGAVGGHDPSPICASWPPPGGSAQRVHGGRPARLACGRRLRRSATDRSLDAKACDRPCRREADPARARS